MGMNTVWETASIGDVSRVVPGYAFKSSDWKPNGIPVVKIRNITGDNFVDLASTDCVSESLLTHRLQKYLLKDGDILVAMTGATAGKVGRVRTQEPLLLNQRVAKIAPLHVDPDFIWSVVSSQKYQDAFFHLADGAAQPNMSGSQIEAVEIPLPPLPIQRRIAGILSAYDDLIENNQRRIEILEEMARRLYREWFVHFHFPGHEGCRFVDSPLGEIPEGWCISSIGEICSRVTDGSHHSPKSVAEGLPMASSKDMHDWGLNLDTARHISPIDFDKLARNDCQPLKNDVLITKDGANYLKHVFVTRVDQEVVLLSSVALLRPSSLIIPHLLAATLKDPATKGRLSNYVTGAAIPRIILSDFKQFQILLPPKAIQGSWGRIAESLTMNIWLLLDQIKNLRRTRDLLLPRLLSGLIDIESLPEPVLSEP
jgi:type I restriction enzyme S subunit